MVLFPKVLGDQGPHTQGSPRSCRNFHSLRSLMEADGYVGVGGAGVRSRRNDL